jgi:hypothetical protein
MPNGALIQEMHVNAPTLPMTRHEAALSERRLHSTLGYRTPLEALTEFQAAATAA